MFATSLLFFFNLNPASGFLNHLVLQSVYLLLLNCHNFLAFHLKINQHSTQKPQSKMVKNGGRAHLFSAETALSGRFESARHTERVLAGHVSVCVLACVRPFTAGG